MKISAGVFASFDDMCWTIPSDRMSNLAHKALYGGVSAQEAKILASMCSCYYTLIMMPERLRRIRVKQLREALKLAASAQSEK